MSYKTPNFRWITGVLLAVIATLTIACDRGRPGQVDVGVSALRISLPVFVAADRGLFKQRGIDVRIRVYDTAQPMVDELVHGRIDVGGYAAYPIVMLASRDAAHPPVVATALIEDRDHRLSYVLAQRQSGLRFPADAAGRKIGILPTAAYHSWLEALLRDAGIAPSDVDIVPIAPSLQGQMLAEHAVDFLFTNDPAATAALVAGVAEIADTGPPCPAQLGDPFGFGAFLLSGTFARSQPEVATQIVAAIDEAIEIVRRDPADALSSMHNYLPPEQRSLISAYPRSRYLTSTEVAANAVAKQIARERDLGILDFTPKVQRWSPKRP